MATLSNAGFGLLKGFEGFKLKPYKATKSEKYWTVGLGHYGPDVNCNKVYTEAECMAFFAKDKVRFENDVNKVWHTGMTLQMFDALFSLAYNHGNVSSTVLKQALAGEGWRNDKKIRSIWLSLYTAGGLLSTRRRKEVNFFYNTEDTGGAYTADSIESGSSAYGTDSGNYGASTGTKATFSTGGKTGTAGGYEANNQNNSYATYSSDNPGLTLSMNKSIYNSKNAGNTKHTRIYKNKNASIVVDELSMPMNEGKIKDTSTNKNN